MSLYIYLHRLILFNLSHHLNKLKRKERKYNQYKHSLYGSNLLISKLNLLEQPFMFTNPHIKKVQ